MSEKNPSDGRQSFLDSVYSVFGDVSASDSSGAVSYPAFPAPPGGRAGRAPAHRAAARRCGVRLEYPTHSVSVNSALFDKSEPSGPCYRIVIHDFGDGCVESVVIKQSERLPKPRKGRKRTSRTRDDMEPEHLARSISRARKSMRHKAMMMRADRMLTLTYRDMVTDLDLAYSHLATFERLCRKQWGKFDFIAVPEYQKRGCLHFHIALNRFYSVGLLRHFWHKAIGSKGGNVDMTSPRTGAQWNRVRLCRYLSKYMSKSIGLQCIGRKRFTSSRGIPAPAKSVYFAPVGPDTFRLILRFIESFSGTSVRQFSLVPSTIFQTWFISTY